MIRCAGVHRIVASLLASTLATGGPAETSAPAAEEAPAREAATETTPEPAPDTAEDPDPAPTTEAGADGEAPSEDPPSSEGLPGVDDAPGEEVPGPAPAPAPAPAAPKPEGPATAPAPAAAEPLGKDRLGCDHSKSCRQLTVTGTVLGSLGVISVAAGIGLFVRDDVVLDDEPAYATSTKPPGLIALTLGSGIVITSVLMLIAAHRGYKQRDAAQKKSAWLRARGAF